MRKAALKAIENLVDQNEKVVFIGSDLGQGTLAEAKYRHPSRVFMEGISEQHLVGLAAGLALEGFIPFIHTIGTFLTRRALDQIIVDVAIQNLPVKLIASGGGMVYSPLGPTHQSVDDFALMRAIPNMVIGAPADPFEMSTMVNQVSKNPGPAYIRVAKGGEPDITSKLANLELGEIREVKSGSNLAIFTTGVMLHECLWALTELNSQKINPAVFHVPYLNPADEELIIKVAKNFENILVIEEHLPNGGLFSMILEIIVRAGLCPKISQLSLPNEYASNYGTQREHLIKAGLDGASISNYIISNFTKN
jgi:transketolase